MKNTLIWLTGLVIVLLFVILLAGQRSSNYFTFESTVRFDVGRDLLWKIINDIDKYQENKKGLHLLKVTDYFGNSVLSWEENYNFGIVKKYEIIIKRNPEILVLKIYNTLTKMQTDLTFELSETSTNSFLKVTEASRLDNLFFRGLKVLSGRDSFVNSEIKWVRVGLYNYLIEN